MSEEDRKLKQKRAFYVEKQVEEGNTDPSIQHELALLLCNGFYKGVPRKKGQYLPYDINAAFSLFTRASDQEYHPAMVALSTFYSLGMGDQKIDIQRAYDLCRLPSLSGDENAKNIRDLLRLRLFIEEEE